MVKINKKTILDRSSLDSYLQKFNERVAEVDASIAKISVEIEKATEEKRSLLLKDMVTAGSEFQKPLANVISKIQNYKDMLDVEKEKKRTFLDIIKNPEADRLLREFQTKSRTELREYQTVTEKGIYEELMALRDKQLALFEKLNVTRHLVDREADEFSRIAKGLGYPQYSLSVAYHQNPKFPNKAIGQEEAITFDCNSIRYAKKEYEMSKRVY